MRRKVIQSIVAGMVRPCVGALVRLVVLPFLAVLAVLAFWAQAYAQPSSQPVSQALIPKALEPLRDTALWSWVQPDLVPWSTRSDAGATGKNALLRGVPGGPYADAWIISADQALTLGLKIEGKLHLLSKELLLTQPGVYRLELKRVKGGYAQGEKIYVDKQPPKLAVTWERRSIPLLTKPLDKTYKVWMKAWQSKSKTSSPGGLLRLWAKDQAAGVQAVRYSLRRLEDYAGWRSKSALGRTLRQQLAQPPSDDQWQAYPGELSLHKAGHLQIWLQAEDRLGNRTPATVALLRLDEQGPQTRVRLVGARRKQVLSQQTKIRLISQDAMSRVGRIEYQILPRSETVQRSETVPRGATPQPKQRGQGFRVYRGSIDLSTLRAGSYTLLYRAVDRLGMQEDVQRYDFDIDAWPPVARMRVQGASVEHKGVLYLGPDTRVVLSGTDRGAGVEKLLYRFALKGPWQTYRRPFGLPGAKRSENQTSGNQISDNEAVAKRTLQFAAVDAFGLQSSVQTVTLGSQRNAIDTDLRFVGSHFQSGKVVYTTPKAKLQLAAFYPEEATRTSKQQVGVEQGERQLQILYKLGDQAPAQRYQEPLQVNELSDRFDPQTGRGPRLTFYAQDALGNRSKPQSLQLSLDSTPPEIRVDARPPKGRPIDPIITRVRMNGVEGQVRRFVLPVDVEIDLTASDMQSGMRELLYSINGRDFQPVTRSLPFIKRKDYDIDVRAINRLGLVSTRRLKLRIR